MSDISVPAMNFNDFNGLASLRADAIRDQNKAIDKTAEQFEGLFLGMLLKEMRKTVPESALFDSNSMKLYEEMRDQQLALEMAKDGPLGIADLLKHNLQQNGHLKADATSLNVNSSMYELQHKARAYPLNAYKAYQLGE